MRFLHVADLHLGFNTYGKEKDYSPFKALDFAIEYAEEHGASLFLIAGDVFDRRDPPSYIQKGFAERVKRLTESGITVFIVTGNHEGAPNPERNIHLDVYSALRIKNVFVAKRIRLYKLRDINIISVPYPYKKNLLAKEEYRDKSEAEIALKMNGIIKDAIKKYVEEADNDNPIIVAAHIPVSDAKVGSETYSTFSFEIPLSRSDFDIDGVSYVALGHLHTRQAMETPRLGIPLVYSGSIDRINFSEENEEKGFYDVEIGADKKPVFTPVNNPFARKFYSIRLYKDSDINAVDFARAGESITRVVLYDDLQDESLLRVLIKRLKKEALVFAGMEDKRDFGNESSFFKASLSVSPHDAIIRYLDEKKQTDKFIEKERQTILETAVKLLKEANE